MLLRKRKEPTIARDLFSANLYAGATEAYCHCRDAEFSSESHPSTAQKQVQDGNLEVVKSWPSSKGSIG